VDWSTAEERLNRGFTMLGIGREGDAKGKGSQKANAERDMQRGQFRLAYDAAERAFIQQTGKKPTPEQADTLLRSVVRNFAERQQEGTTDVYGAAATYDATISEADRARVRAAYAQKYGRPPTDAWVTRYIIAARRSATP